MCECRRVGSREQIDADNVLVKSGVNADEVCAEHSAVGAPFDVLLKRAEALAVPGGPSEPDLDLLEPFFRVFHLFRAVGLHQRQKLRSRDATLHCARVQGLNQAVTLDIPVGVASKFFRTDRPPREKGNV